MKLENKKEIAVLIDSKQTDSDGECVETKTKLSAICGNCDGIMVLIYELEECLNVLMLSKNYVKLVKSGDVEAEMTFSVDKKTKAVFSAAGRSLEFDVLTKRCQMNDKALILSIEYSLFADGEFLSDYQLNIKVIKGTD